MTKREYILNYLILKIQDEQYDDGLYLPSIRFISIKFKVSYKLVHGIYQELKSMNLIKSIPGVGYIVNEKYLDNLWSIKNKYKNESEKIKLEFLDKKKYNINDLKGDWIVKHLDFIDGEISWLSLSKFHFFLEKDYLNLPLRKILTCYGKPITGIGIDVKGILSKDRKVFFDVFFGVKKETFIQEHIHFYSFNELVAEVIFYWPATKYSKSINLNI